MVGWCTVHPGSPGHLSLSLPTCPILWRPLRGVLGPSATLPRTQCFKSNVTTSEGKLAPIERQGPSLGFLEALLGANGSFLGRVGVCLVCSDDRRSPRPYRAHASMSMSVVEMYECPVDRKGTWVCLYHVQAPHRGANRQNSTH